MKPIAIIIILGALIGCQGNGQIDRFYETNLPTSFDRNWYKLTETDSGYIVYKPCDAMNKSISIKNEVVSIDYGQEEVDYKIVRIDSNQRGFYRFIVETEHITDSLFFCSVDDESGIATWKEAFESFDTKSDEVFISQANYFNFKEFIEPCQSCYGDECETIEKSLFAPSLSFRILNMNTNNNYPSSAKNDSMCIGWFLDEDNLNLILKNSRHISGSEWHNLYDHLPCQVTGELVQGETKFTFSINGGSWLSIGNDDTSSFMGYFGVPGLFISESWSLEEME